MRRFPASRLLSGHASPAPRLGVLLAVILAGCGEKRNASYPQTRADRSRDVDETPPACDAGRPRRPRARSRPEQQLSASCRAGYRGAEEKPPTGSAYLDRTGIDAHCKARPRTRPDAHADGVADADPTESPTPTPTQTREPRPRPRRPRGADADPDGGTARLRRRPRARGRRWPTDELFADRYRARPPPRGRRHGDRPARMRHAPGAPRGGQAARRAPGRGRELRLALPARGARRRAARAPQHRPGLRLRRRRGDGAPVHRHGVGRRPAARRSCASSGGSTGRRRQHPRPGLPRARLRAPQGRRAPRRQAGQPAAQGRRRRQARRLRDRQGRRAVRHHQGRLVLGTAAYLSPEQARGEPPARRATSTRSASSPTSCSPAGSPTRRRR